MGVPNEKPFVAGFAIEDAGAVVLLPPKLKDVEVAGEPKEKDAFGAAPFSAGEAAGVDELDRFPGRPRIGLRASSVGAACLKPSEEPVIWTSSSSSSSSSAFLSVKYFSAPRFMA